MSIDPNTLPVILVCRGQDYWLQVRERSGAITKIELPGASLSGVYRHARRLGYSVQYWCREGGWAEMIPEGVKVY